MFLSNIEIIDEGTMFIAKLIKKKDKHFTLTDNKGNKRRLND